MENAEFNYLEGQRRKTHGMERAASYPCDLPVNRARNVAILLAKRLGEVDADVVHKYLAERLPDVLEALQPNAWGSIFKTPKLTFTGRIKQSERIARHTGSIRIWSYNP